MLSNRISYLAFYLAKVSSRLLILKGHGVVYDFLSIFAVPTVATSWGASVTPSTRLVADHYLRALALELYREPPALVTCNRQANSTAQYYYIHSETLQYNRG